MKNQNPDTIDRQRGNAQTQIVDNTETGELCLESQ